ncbi:peptide ABC transporter ATP-binding protein [Microbacterium sp. Root61]|uniref:ATP-binding cassette domain-containing protein n=1 Tax=Microbacterium sp. Root61 TaxID=1736570 RepID=UPI0006F3C23B|nr:ABC transporter ATP-binding protein [Microbacterium sp. Root61]KRA24746.1 peptide ABC transporter ATP-binding protein [Microbacterium sp. Root61]
MSDPVLEVKDLHVKFGRRSRTTQVIRGVDLTIAQGETLSLVGESGSGKSTIGRAILGLAPISAGSVRFAGTDITHLTRRRRRVSVVGLQAIFQDPYSSLNPAMTVEDILIEPLVVRGIKNARSQVKELLDGVHLPADSGRRLASEFSGGQRQRIAIARALALSPRLIVCDEPTSALDVSTQARILTLLRELQDRTGVAYLFISHDLGVVRSISDRIAVLRHGRIVETGPTRQVTEAPQHPYTRALLLATPVTDPAEQARRRAARHASGLVEAEQDDAA